jgi:hypothetical protein
VEGAKQAIDRSPVYNEFENLPIIPVDDSLQGIQDWLSDVVEVSRLQLRELHDPDG